MEAIPHVFGVLPGSLHPSLRMSISNTLTASHKKEEKKNKERVRLIDSLIDSLFISGVPICSFTNLFFIVKRQRERETDG